MNILVTLKEAIIDNVKPTGCLLQQNLPQGYLTSNSENFHPQNFLQYTLYEVQIRLYFE